VVPIGSAVCHFSPHADPIRHYVDTVAHVTAAEVGRDARQADIGDGRRGWCALASGVSLRRENVGFMRKPPP